MRRKEGKGWWGEAMKAERKPFGEALSQGGKRTADPVSGPLKWGVCCGPQLSGGKNWDLRGSHANLHRPWLPPVLSGAEAEVWLPW